MPLDKYGITEPFTAHKSDQVFARGAALRDELCPALLQLSQGCRRVFAIGAFRQHASELPQDNFLLPTQLIALSEQVE
jgi:hypothetical protein